MCSPATRKETRVVGFETFELPTKPTAVCSKNLNSKQFAFDYAETARWDEYNAVVPFL